MLALPLPATNPLRLADWLELTALLAPDGNSSVGDLERALAASGVLQGGGPEDTDDLSGRDAASLKCLEVFRELEARDRAAAEAYAFQLDPKGVLLRRHETTHFSAYVFCLCLSYTRFTHIPGSRTFPRRYFEDLACLAAQNYLNGESVRFAAPRTVLPGRFYEALDQLCRLMIEGGPHRRRDRQAGQDRKLDVVAWRHFPDRQAGKVLMFGQCASGDDWADKLGELNPDAFCKSLLVGQPISPFIRAFFMPHRVESADWEDTCRQGGIVFDRCRLAYWAHQSPPPADSQKYIDATATLLDRLHG